MARLLIGTSGWVYQHWRGVFYPDELPQKEWFNFYAGHFDTVEINYSFYRLPSLETFNNWRKTAPEGFIFTVKANRFITHIKKLKDPEQTLENFYRNLYGLEDRCGAVLFQLPPRWKLNLERLRELLDIVPEKYRLVFEFRDQSWLVQDVFDLLSENNVALCAADSPIIPPPRIVTADFFFYRMHGGDQGATHRYDDDELSRLAGQVKEHLGAGRDVFVYFNNDYYGFAVENALRLKELVK